MATRKTSSAAKFQLAREYLAGHTVRSGPAILLEHTQVIKEPILSAKVDFKALHALKYPMLGSPKLDGYRAFNGGNVLYSRKLKPIRNQHTQLTFGHGDLIGIDGELMVGKPSASDVYRKTNSGVSAILGTPDVKLWVFDDWTIGDQPFQIRISTVASRIAHLRKAGHDNLRLVQHDWINGTADLLRYEERCLRAGFEGVMLRDPNGPYREGRCGKETPWLFKMKRFETSEARIVEVHEKLHNDNPAELNELGRTKRSGHKANKRAAGTLGGFTLELIEDMQAFGEIGQVVFPKGTRFRSPLGKGWTDVAKQELWDRRDSLPGLVVSFDHFAYGVKDKPRFPKVTKIKGFRDMEMDG